MVFLKGKRLRELNGFFGYSSEISLSKIDDPLNGIGGKNTRARGMH